jgi:hypothetical protein
MHVDSTIPAFAPLTLGQQENTKQITALRDEASEGHIAEHIRGMVAATMGSLAVHSTDAPQWQEWALGLADGLALPVAG